MNAVIGIDLGGTRVKGVAIDANGKLLHQLYADIDHQDEHAWKKIVVEQIKFLSSITGSENDIIGISAPGLPNDEHTAIAYMPGRMSGLENFIWENYLGRPVVVLNDAVAAMLAEVKFGAAKNRKHVAMITLGTGVGGAILIDGRPYMGAFQKAGHLGHMAIDDSGEVDITGMPGSLESCIGDCSVFARSRGTFRTTKGLILASKAGDAWAREVWLKSVRQLAIALASLTNILSPEMIVLGGGITEAGKDLFDPLQEMMSAYEWRAGGNRVEIEKAVCGDLAGAIGAACFAMQSSKELIKK